MPKYDPMLSVKQAMEWTREAMETTQDLRPYNQIKAENLALKEENEQLKAIIALIDTRAPRADETCDEPGITLSEAARRELGYGELPY